VEVKKKGGCERGLRKRGLCRQGIPAGAGCTGRRGANVLERRLSPAPKATRTTHLEGQTRYLNRHLLGIVLEKILCDIYGGGGMGCEVRLGEQPAK
jgi:hypothetical protein